MNNCQVLIQDGLIKKIGESIEDQSEFTLDTQ